MAHTRIRKFNTRDTYPEQRLDNDLCQAVVAGDTVYLRGQIAQDLDTSVSVAIGDPAGAGRAGDAQRRAAARRVRCRLADICKVTVYLTDIRYREPVYRVMGRWLKGVHPVSTGTRRGCARAARVGGRDRRDRGHLRRGGVTFSLLGRCDQTGRLGMVISSSSPAVAARCAHARAGVGVAASQNVTDPRLGPALLDALTRRGGDARAALDRVVGGRARRVPPATSSRRGRVAAVHRRPHALGPRSAPEGGGCAAAGNLLADEGVLDAMVDVSFDSRRGATSATG